MHFAAFICSCSTSVHISQSTGPTRCGADRDVYENESNVIAEDEMKCLGAPLKMTIKSARFAYLYQNIKHGDRNRHFEVNS